MDRNYHILHDGTLRRDENTIRFDRADGETDRIPVKTAEALFCYGEVTYNTKLVRLLDDYGVELHVFGWNDQYIGSHVPSKRQQSGKTVVQQVTAYTEPEERIKIARAFVRGSIHNMRRNVQYYQSRRETITEDAVADLASARDTVENATDVEKLLGIEADARRTYYRTFDAILQGLSLDRRTYNPPESEANALISFGNSLVYASTTSAIRQTALDPTVSYLHEPGDRRCSLALDIADVFKPILADRVLFRVVNRGQISSEDFRDETEGYLLTEEGRETYLKEYEETLRTTVEHPELNRKVSYKYLLRLEAYKLKKHLLGGEPYEPLERWW